MEMLCYGVDRGLLGPNATLREPLPATYDLGLLAGLAELSNTNCLIIQCTFYFPLRDPDFGQ